MTDLKISRRFFLIGGAAAAASALSACSSVSAPKRAVGSAPLPQTTSARSNRVDVCDTYNGIDAAWCSKDETRRISTRPANAPAPHMVTYTGTQPVGSIIINNQTRNLYFLNAPGQAIVFRIAIGKVGETISPNLHDETTFIMQRGAQWPIYSPDRDGDGWGDENFPGGINNPLGARAIYLGRENGTPTTYRIHGTSQPWHLGEMVSGGCFRMFNADVIYLYDMVERFGYGGKVIVLNDPSFEDRRIASANLPNYKLTLS
ncbi:MAG TPA: L,D-transpeptidase [Alphaproteobacteria bacterium]